MTSQIPIMINGLPGNVATEVALQVLHSKNEFQLIPYSFTGPAIEHDSVMVKDTQIKLIQESERDNCVNRIRNDYGSFITVDYTVPDAIMQNADYYVKNDLSFVMGTTGGDRNKLSDIAANSAICAVIAPNMAMEIVALQSMMQKFAEKNKGLLSGCSLQITESHQLGKADTSGTAKAMIKYFNSLGIEFVADQINMIRDPRIQLQYNIPEKVLKGHGWHTYIITGNEEGSAAINALRESLYIFFKDNKSYSEYQEISMTPNQVELYMDSGFFGMTYNDNSITLTHNINGRAVYATGTLNAVRFLYEKSGQDIKGKVFSMIDVGDF